MRHHDRWSHARICPVWRNVSISSFQTRRIVLNEKKTAPFSWRRLRRATNEGFSKSSVRKFYETQMTEAVLLASDLLGSPARWDQHFRRAATSTTLSVFYGYPTLMSEEDSNVEAINDFAERLFKAAFMGAHPVQFFPWLRHLPSR